MTGILPVIFCFFEDYLLLKVIKSKNILKKETAPKTKRKMTKKHRKALLLGTFLIGFLKTGDVLL